MAQLERYAHTLGYVKSLQMQNLSELFQAPNVSHMPSIHPKKLADLIKSLRLETQQNRNIFNIFLTAIYSLLRLGEYIKLEWSWVDFEQKIITILSEIMKMKAEFRVPISKQFDQLLLLMKQQKINEYVFPSVLKAGPMDIDNFAKFLRKHGFRKHGLRSTGRIWMAENNIDYAVAEMCLAHKVGSHVSLAYNRSDLLEDRRATMQRWCNFVESCLKDV